MTNNELIIADLCAKLQYNLLVQRGQRVRKVLAVYPDSNRIVLDNSPYMPQTYSVDEVKPYLRSLSNMTEKEKSDFCWMTHKEYDGYDNNDCPIYTGNNTVDCDRIDEVIDFLNSHHFDYRGLIKQGLALEATSDMYN